MAQDALWEMIQAGAVEILSLGTDDVARMRDLMRKYRDLPMDLADAALVRVAERERLRRTFTLDRRDFQIYRPSRIGRFAVLRPGKLAGNHERKIGFLAKELAARYGKA